MAYPKSMDGQSCSVSGCIEKSPRLKLVGVSVAVVHQVVPAREVLLKRREGDGEGY